jgi:hypothetical protein
MEVNFLGDSIDSKYELKVNMNLMLKHKFDAIQLSDTNVKAKFYVTCPLSF